MGHDQPMSFRATPTDRQFIDNAIIEAVARSGLPVKSRSDIVRAALWHFATQATADQRAVALDIGNMEASDIEPR